MNKLLSKIVYALFIVTLLFAMVFAVKAQTDYTATGQQATSTAVSSCPVVQVLCQAGSTIEYYVGADGCKYPKCVPPSTETCNIGSVKYYSCPSTTNADYAESKAKQVKWCNCVADSVASDIAKGHWNCIKSPEAECGTTLPTPTNGIIVKTNTDFSLKIGQTVSFSNYPDISFRLDAAEEDTAKFTVFFSKTTQIGQDYGGWGPNPALYPSLNPGEPTTLYREVKECGTDKLKIAPQMIILNGAYKNYVCESRKQQHCYDDGSFDQYYVERCDYGEQGLQRTIKMEKGQEYAFINIVNKISSIGITYKEQLPTDNVQGSFKFVSSEANQRTEGQKPIVQPTQPTTPECPSLVQPHCPENTKATVYVRDGCKYYSCVPKQCNDYSDSSCGQNITKPQENNSTIGDTSTCGGCYYNSICIPIGTRFLNSQPSYCDYDKQTKHQKPDTSSCQNNYECLSNTCSSGKCVNLQKQLEEQGSLIDKILSFLGLKKKVVTTNVQAEVASKD